MNLSAGQSSRKEHLSSGAKTACNRRTSGIGANDFNTFKWVYENHPNDCCEKCTNRFIEKLNRLKK